MSGAGLPRSTSALETMIAKNRFRPFNARTSSTTAFSDPEATGSPDVLKSYSHDAVSTANLLAAHSFYSEAEQAYRLATQLWPGNPESIGGLAELLASGWREDEAGQILETHKTNAALKR